MHGTIIYITKRKPHKLEGKLVAVSQTWKSWSSFGKWKNILKEWAKGQWLTILNKTCL